MKKGKKQSLAFGGISKLHGTYIVTADLEWLIEASSIDPKPLNRKSRRAMPKMIKKILA